MRLGLNPGRNPSKGEPCLWAAIIGSRSNKGHVSDVVCDNERVVVAPALIFDDLHAEGTYYGRW